MRGYVYSGLAQLSAQILLDFKYNEILAGSYIYNNNTAAARCHELSIYIRSSFIYISPLKLVCLVLFLLIILAFCFIIYIVIRKY